MPCSDGGWDRSYQVYEDTRRIEDLESRNDQLARIACAALTYLEKQGQEDFLLLENDEVREWWTAHKEFDRKRKAAEEEKRRLAKLKRDALAKLSPEERKVLGIKTK